VEHWSGRMPLHVKYLRELGESGLVKKEKQILRQSCMLVGYAENHGGDCYEILHWKTNR
jgi:hypothetical protein